MKDNFPTKEMKELFAAITSIKDEKESAAFFRDLLTLAELEEFANRWQMVKLLIQEHLCKTSQNAESFYNNRHPRLPVAKSWYGWV